MKMHRISILILTLGLLLSSCATQNMSKVDGQSLVLDNLATSVMSQINNMEYIYSLQDQQGIRGGRAKLVKTSIVQPKVGGRWVEEWIIQRVGYQVAYTIPFSDSSDGLTHFSVENNARKIPTN
jgi:hypothetical protein